MRRILTAIAALLVLPGACDSRGATGREPLACTVSWIGNSFSGASNRWVRNFLIHTQVQPDGTVNTWSHWDEGGKKFGVYRDGEVVGNTIRPHAHLTPKRGRSRRFGTPPCSTAPRRNHRRVQSRSPHVIHRNPRRGRQDGLPPD